MLFSLIFKDVPLFQRLSEEVGRLHTELEEKHSMNNTLQMELGIYDKMHNG